MLVIEYVNVKSAGAFSQKIKKNGFRQIFISAILGFIPGCLGTYTVVTFYTHNLISFGALTAAFVATMGDEAFLLLSTSPSTGLIILGVLLVIGIISGVVVDAIQSRNKTEENPIHFHVHKDELPSNQNKWQAIKSNLKSPSPQRALLIFGAIGVILFALFTDMGHSHDFLTTAPQHKECAIESNENNHETEHGKDCTNTSHKKECTIESHEHNHEAEYNEDCKIETQHQECSGEHHHEHGINWMAITFVVISVIALFILSFVPEHFLKDHLWNHIIKKHFYKVLGWTVFVISIVFVLNQYIHVQEMIAEYKYHILIVALLIGLLPESGPHVIFLSLYLSGAIPLSILLANSIVQDGHGSLPLFAEDKKAFFKVKIINLIVGLIVGCVGLQFNF